MCRCVQELEATIESLKTSLQEKEDKYSKMVKTLKAARSRIDALKAEKDQVEIFYHGNNFTKGLANYDTVAPCFIQKCFTTHLHCSVKCFSKLLLFLCSQLTPTSLPIHSTGISRAGAVQVRGDEEDDRG